MNDKPIKPPIRIRLPERRKPDIVPEYPEVDLPEINLEIPWYRSTKFYRIAGISGAVVGGILAFVPGFAPLGKIAAGLGVSSYGIAEARRKIKGEDTWLGLLIDFLATILKKLLKK